MLGFPQLALAEASAGTMQLALAEASAGPMDEVANPHQVGTDPFATLVPKLTKSKKYIYMIAGSGLSSYVYIYMKCVIIT